MSELLEKIRSRGYWKVIIRPADLVENRIENPDALYRILDNSAARIRHRWFGFPHIQWESETRRGKDWIGQEFQWGRYLELWRFYQSGQFIAYRGLYGDWADHAPALPVPAEADLRACLEAEDALLQLTEVFQLAVSLTFTAAAADCVHLAASLHNLEGRQLVLQRGAARPDTIATAAPSAVAEFVYRREFPKITLAIQSKELAQQAAGELFRHFDWHPPARLLQDLQANFGARPTPAAGT